MFFIVLGEDEDGGYLAAFLGLEAHVLQGSDEKLLSPSESQGGTGE